MSDPYVVQRLNAAGSGLALTFGEGWQDVGVSKDSVTLDRAMEVLHQTQEAFGCPHRLRQGKWALEDPIAGGHTDVWKCLGENCGALCREAGRMAHDEAFHLTSMHAVICFDEFGLTVDGVGPDPEVLLDKWGPAARQEFTHWPELEPSIYMLIGPEEIPLAREQEGESSASQVVEP